MASKSASLIGYSPVWPPASSLTMSRWPTWRAYSWSRWNRIRSRAGGSSPSHRSPGWPYVGKVVGLDDGPGTHRLGAKARDQLRERLVGGYVPSAVPAVGKRVGDLAPLETPLQPPQLDVGKVLEQLDRRPARGQPAAAQLAAGQRFELA